MINRIICLLLMTSLLASAGTSEAVKALVPGLGQFSMDQKYRGLMYASTQLGFLYLGLDALSKREAAALGTRRAFEAARDADRDQIVTLNIQRHSEYQKSVDRNELKAGIFLGLFSVIYGTSIVDAFLTNPKKDEAVSKIHVGFNPGQGGTLITTLIRDF